MIEDDRILSCGNVRRYLKNKLNINAGYTRIEYIQNTGSNWIDTGITPNETIKIQLQLVCHGTTGGAIIGTNTDNDNNDYRLFNYTDNHWYYDFKDQRCIDGLRTVSLNTKYYLELGNNYIKDLTSNTILVSGSTVSKYSAPSTLAVFQGSSGSKYDIYFLKIWLNDVLVREYIPCIDTSAEENMQVGLYDNVSKTFTCGTGYFYAGPEISGSTIPAILETEYFDDRLASIQYARTLLANIDYKPPDAVSPSDSVGKRLVSAHVFKKMLEEYNTPYTRLSYIHFDGNQYINTGYVANQDTRVILVADVTPKSGIYAVFGGRRAANRFPYSLWYYIDRFRYDYRVGSVGQYTTGFSGVHTVETNKNKVLLDGKTIITVSTSPDFDTANPLALASTYSDAPYGDENNYDTRRMIADIHSFKIYDNEQLVRDYIPVKMNDGQVGLYDLVENKFYGNSGTGSITAGPEI